MFQNKDNEKTLRTNRDKAFDKYLGITKNNLKYGFLTTDQEVAGLNPAGVTLTVNGFRSFPGTIFILLPAVPYNYFLLQQLLPMH